MVSELSERCILCVTMVLFLSGLCLLVVSFPVLANVMPSPGRALCTEGRSLDFDHGMETLAKDWHETLAHATGFWSNSLF